MIRNTLNNWLRTAALAGAMASFTAASASASFTTVKASKPSEMGIEQILEGTYGGNFTASGNNFSNGAITATRINDDLDQVWTGGTFDIEAKAKFSGYTQSLGYVGHPGNGPITNLLNVTGFGLAASGSLSHVVIGEDFCFTRDGDSGLQMSELSENSDGRDHMVSFAIQGLSNNLTYLLFFEDMNLTQSTWANRSVADYNDLVVQVSRSTPSQSAIAAPLPPAILTGGLLLAGNAIFAVGRKVKKSLK
jgi:hypothetical protein